MPNRYEREIEEILRNLEQTDPKPGLGQRLGERMRKRPGPRPRAPQRSPISFHFTTLEWLLIIAVGAALIAGGYAYAQGEADVFTGVLALIGMVCLIMIALSQFLFRPRGPQQTRYGNVTITPLRRDPLSYIKTRVHLFMLKLRYRRRNKH